ncbi:MAG TPA: VWA domain-containing protein [Bryobacteraceae bacterium]|nr:VWA domain-containing protein [Bryobacteraceae bacterium]
MAAQTAPIFRASVALIHVDAEVTLDGRILSGMTKDDFRVFDEHSPQTIVHFASEQEPLDLILLFDFSNSMRPVVQSVAAAARQGLQELRQGDRVCIWVFNRHSQEIAPFTSDLDAVARTIEQEVPNQSFAGGTWIRAAVDAAALRLMKEPKNQRRRAVLIITDDYGTHKEREQSVVRDFWEADAILSGLIVRNSYLQAIHTGATIVSPEMLLIYAGTGMKGIAAKTGGDTIHSSDAGAAFQESMRRIRSRYSLYYAQPDGKPGTTRSIRVELANNGAKQYPKAHVRARAGYVVPK